MIDVQRLQAEAEDAQIRGEMARSQSQKARSNLRHLRVRWSEAKRSSIIDWSAEPHYRSRRRAVES